MRGVGYRPMLDGGGKTGGGKTVSMPPATADEAPAAEYNGIRDGQLPTNKPLQNARFERSILEFLRNAF